MKSISSGRTRRRHQNTKEQRKKIRIDKIIKWKNWQQKRKYDKSEC